MLKVKRIKLVQFRNYTDVRFDFTERITGICGANGTGKTNLLDAIYYLGFTKSYFSRPENQNVTYGLQGMRIEGNFSLGEKDHSLVCIVRENNRKEFSVDDEAYKKFSDHIGRFPCVMIAPDDVDLINGGSEGRRNFIDALLSQLNQVYLRRLIDYNRILQQRNSLLRQSAETGSPDSSLLEALDEQLSANGHWIFEERTRFMKAFLPLVIHHYRKIAEKDDAITMTYESQLADGNMMQLLRSSFPKDQALQRTNTGIHKDDISVTMQGLVFKSQASQGQKKSLLFALKLAEWDILRERKGFAPILLLDDVFEKLDAHRMHNLLQWVCAENEGQVFITDTHKERLTQQLEDIGVGFQIIELEN